jgi:transcriptional regulator with XRE-family HTH domain
MCDGRITPSQVTAARQMLGWWQSDLAKRLHVSEKSIRDFESGEPFGRSLDLDLVREAFESAGVEFITGGAPGVTLRKDNVD